MTSRKSGLSSPDDACDPGDFIPPAAKQEVESPLGTRYYDNTLIFICNRVLDLGRQGGQRGGVSPPGSTSRNVIRSTL